MSQDVPERGELSIRQRRFLSAFENLASIRLAADAAGINRRSHYRWLTQAKYAAAFREARDVAADQLESEEVRRAVDGVKRIVFNPRTGQPYVDPHTGEPYSVTTYSDRLLMMLLRATLPEKYGRIVNLRAKHPKATEADVERFMRQHGLS
ncbi:MAG: hypothetical protein KDA52_01385 [Planctomycetaceae bacterium]|nr:hypothetical protein [Planctomycetaceae bacterium]